MLWSLGLVSDIQPHVIKASETLISFCFFQGDKEGIANSEDIGRDLSSVQTLITKQAS